MVSTVTLCECHKFNKFSSKFCNEFGNKLTQSKFLNVIMIYFPSKLKNCCDTIFCNKDWRYSHVRVHYHFHVNIYFQYKFISYLC